MKNRVYRFDDVVKWTAEVLKARGEDYAYIAPDGEACRYVHENSNGNLVPGCLIAHILVSNTSIFIEDLLDYEGDAVLGEYGNFSFTDKAYEWMKLAQREQDQSRPWGECVAHAHSVVARTNYNFNEERMYTD